MKWLGRLLIRRREEGERRGGGEGDWERRGGEGGRGG